MRAVMVEAPESFLAERERLGLDRRDEMWEGELHMPPDPTQEHQRTAMDLAIALAPHLRRMGLAVVHDSSIRVSDQSYRIPDLIVVDRSRVVPTWIYGPSSFAVEVRSLGDETYKKLPYYSSLGLPELLVIDRDTKRVELFVLRDGELVADEPDSDGWLRSHVLGIAVRQANDQVEIEIAGERTFIPDRD